MNDKTISELTAIARNPERELPERIAALRELGARKDRYLVPDLRSIWNRPKVHPQLQVMDWDPLAVERVVNLYTILALSEHRDNALLSEIAPLVKQAGTVLTGPYSETKNAAIVIGEIKSLGPLGDVIQLTAGSESTVIANAVRTLQQLHLPNAPTGGAIPDIAGLRTPVSFTAQRLSDEITSIVRLSQGSAVLSAGASDFIHAHDFDRGGVERTGVTIADILEREIDMLDLTYAVLPGHVEICTFSEAGSRWRQAWPAYRPELARQGWKTQ